ncbi:GNAT family N-acetyltransferase [Nocardia sp. NPDC056100]|uniref:GNAT family N-acetyltransferase n=1 Tax=Nocardia sp. NPDC056100 TaxID=3345712 RepID=UPI0035E2925C
MTFGPSGSHERTEYVDRLPFDYLQTSVEETGPTTVGPACITDGPGIARAHVLASRAAYRDLPGAKANLDEFLVSDLGPRKIADWSELATSGDPGLLVASTVGGIVAGFIWVSMSDDGSGAINSWYVHPNWHGDGVGRDLMRAGLDQLGNVGVYTETIHGTAAVDRYQRYGFTILEGLRDTPRPLREAGIYAPLVALKRPALESISSI